MTEGDAHDHASTEPSPAVDPAAAAAVEAFYALHRHMHAHFVRICGSLELTPQLGAVLRGLHRPSPMRELARRLALDASNLTTLVDRLEQRGLVERRPDPGDRRVRQLVLTPEGVCLRQELDLRLFADPPLLAGLDAHQRAALGQLLATAAEAHPQCSP